jgi:hypothetical protein
VLGNDSPRSERARQRSRTLPHERVAARGMLNMIFTGFAGAGHCQGSRRGSPPTRDCPRGTRHWGENRAHHLCVSPSRNSKLPLHDGANDIMLLSIAQIFSWRLA